MALRDLQCPQCGGSFRTSNRTKRFCDSVCQNKHKNTVRVTQRDFRPEYQQQHRRNSGADASRRAAQGPPAVDWAAVTAKFLADTAGMYEGDDE